MLDRRNPLSVADQRKSKAEFSRATGRQIDKVYGLAYLDDKGVERIFYVGICVDYDRRWKQHYTAIIVGTDPKPAYEQARFVGAENVYMVHLDPEGEFTEREWEDILTEQGHELTNVGGTVDSMRKRRGKSEMQKAFNAVNKANAHAPGELDKLVLAAREKGWI
jgi:hypothetical protein